MRGESKEFAFTRLMTCGLCGSGITGQEKFRELKNGGENRHVYYGCTRSRDINCKCGYMREDEIIKQLVDLIDQLDIDDKFIKQKFKEEYERMRKFQNEFLGIGKIAPINNEFNPRLYMTHVLSKGSLTEKREFLSCIKSKIKMKEKNFILKKDNLLPPNDFYRLPFARLWVLHNI